MIVSVTLVWLTSPERCANRWPSGARLLSRMAVRLAMWFVLAVLFMVAVIRMLQLLVMAALCSVMPEGQAVLELKRVLLMAPLILSLFARADLPTCSDMVLISLLLVGMALLSLTQIMLFMIMLWWGTLWTELLCTIPIGTLLPIRPSWWKCCTVLYLN